MGDTNPMAPGALRLAVPSLDQEHPALGGAGLGLRGSGSAAADGEGTQVPEGCHHGGHQRGLHAIPPVGVGGLPKQGWRAIPPAEGLVERGPSTARPCGTRGRANNPHPGSAPVAVQLRKHPMRMSSRLRRLGGCSSRVCCAQATFSRELSVRRRPRGGGSAWLTWASQRWRAGAGSLRAI